MSRGKGRGSSRLPVEQEAQRGLGLIPGPHRSPPQLKADTQPTKPPRHLPLRSFRKPSALVLSHCITNYPKFSSFKQHPFKAGPADFAGFSAQCLGLAKFKVKVKVLAGLGSSLAWGKNALPKEFRLLAIFGSLLCWVVLDVSLLAVRWGQLFKGHHVPRHVAPFIFKPAIARNPPPASSL